MVFCMLVGCQREKHCKGYCKYHYSRNWDLSHKELISKNKKRDLIRMKKRVFEYYGESCTCCEESVFGFLTIDHIDGKASMNHKSDMKGKKLYSWLIRNNFPKGFQTLCWNCNSGSSNGICPHKLR